MSLSSSYCCISFSYRVWLADARPATGSCRPSMPGRFLLILTSSSPSVVKKKELDETWDLLSSDMAAIRGETCSEWFGNRVTMEFCRLVTEEPASPEPSCSVYGDYLSNCRKSWNCAPSKVALTSLLPSRRSSTSALLRSSVFLRTLSLDVRLSLM